MRSWLWESMRRLNPRGRPRCAATWIWRSSFWFEENGKDPTMGTNGTDIVTDARLGEESLRHLAAGSLDRPPVRKRALDYLALDGGPTPETDAEDFALRPLVDRIAYGIARGLIVAVKELEHHIAAETRKV